MQRNHGVSQQVFEIKGYDMQERIENIVKSEVVTLKEQVEYQEGQFVIKMLAQKDGVRMALFAFDKGVELASHVAKGDAFVTCLEGVGRITIDSEEYIVHKGESIVMPANHPHSVYGLERFKMLLVVVF